MKTNDQEEKNESDIEEFDHDSMQETKIISTSDCLKYLSLIKNKLIYSSGQNSHLPDGTPAYFDKPAQNADDYQRFLQKWNFCKILGFNFP